MPILHFKGRVLPETSHITIPKPENFFWAPYDSTENPIGFRIEINNSRIDAICQFDSYDTVDKSILYRQALELTRIFVDLIAFRQGKGLTIVFDNYLLPGGSLKPIHFEYEFLGELCTAFNLEDPSFAEVRS